MMKKMEIETVIAPTGYVLGFRARREVVFGICQGEIGWAATPNIRNPEWVSGFATRKEAEKYLAKLKGINL